MVNGVTINENLRGQADRSSSRTRSRKPQWRARGISAEFGRFGGGVVNVVTKSGGNNFSGSFRDTLSNDKWRTLTPFEDRALAASPTARDPRIDKVVPQHEYTLGGRVDPRQAVVLHGRPAADDRERSDSSSATNVPYTFISRRAATRASSRTP